MEKVLEGREKIDQIKCWREVETVFRGKLKIHNTSYEGMGFDLCFYASGRAFYVVLWRALEGFYC